MRWMTRLLYGDDQDCLVFSRPTTIIGTWSLRGIAEPLGCRSISADNLQKIRATAVVERNRSQEPQGELKSTLEPHLTTDSEGTIMCYQQDTVKKVLQCLQQRLEVAGQPKAAEMNNQRVNRNIRVTRQRIESKRRRKPGKWTSSAEVYREPFLSSKSDRVEWTRRGRGEHAKSEMNLDTWIRRAVDAMTGYVRKSDHAKHGQDKANMPTYEHRTKAPESSENKNQIRTVCCITLNRGCSTFHVQRQQIFS